MKAYKTQLFEYHTHDIIILIGSRHNDHVLIILTYNFQLIAIGVHVHLSEIDTIVKMLIWVDCNDIHYEQKIKLNISN